MDDDRSLTYAELDERTNALANELAKLGVGEHDRLAILCRNGHEFVESIVAAAKLGADVLPLNTSFAAGELEAVMSREQPPVLVHDAEFDQIVRDAKLEDSLPRVLARVEGDPDAVTLEQLIERGSREPPESPAEEGRTVILTSGTTGTPKGARLARPGGPRAARTAAEGGPDPGRLGLPDPGSAVPRARLRAADPRSRHSAARSCSRAASTPSETLALIERHRVESMAAVPTMLKRIMDLPAADAAPLRRQLAATRSCAAARRSTAGLARAFMDEFGPVLYNLYGSTEMAWATIATPQDLLQAPGHGRPPAAPHAASRSSARTAGRCPPGETGQDLRRPRDAVRGLHGRTRRPRADRRA